MTESTIKHIQQGESKEIQQCVSTWCRFHRWSDRAHRNLQQRKLLSWNTEKKYSMADYYQIPNVGIHTSKQGLFLKGSIIGTPSSSSAIFPGTTMGLLIGDAVVAGGDLGGVGVLWDAMIAAGIRDSTNQSTILIQLGLESKEYFLGYVMSHVIFTVCESATTCAPVISRLRDEVDVRKWNF